MGSPLTARRARPGPITGKESLNHLKPCGRGAGQLNPEARLFESARQSVLDPKSGGDRHRGDGCPPTDVQRYHETFIANCLHLAKLYRTTPFRESESYADISADCLRTVWRTPFINDNVYGVRAALELVYVR